MIKTKRILNHNSYLSFSQKCLEHLNTLLFSMINIGNQGEYSESGEINLIKALSKIFSGNKKIIVFDVGANIGGYSAELSKYFSKDTKIYSFEPSKITFNKLLKNTKKHSNVNTYNFALSNKKQKLILYSDKNESGLASIYNRRLDHFGIKMNLKEYVETNTIDNFCKENKISHINFLKMDIERHELACLEGAKRMIKGKKIDYIQFEFGGCNVDSRTFFQDFYYLLGDGYQIYRILNNGIYNLGKYREQYERFITTNYLAVLK